MNNYTDLKCRLCETAEFFISQIFGNALSKMLLVSLVKLYYTYEHEEVDLTRYIKIDRIGDLFFDEIFSDNTFCTYIYPVCNQDKIELMNLDQDI